MSFSKAQDLVRLAHMAASRRHGVSLDDIRAEFDVSHRTAQRMTEALETVFTNVETEDGEDRRRRWLVADPMLRSAAATPGNGDRSPPDRQPDRAWRWSPAPRGRLG